jgi:hypothetical protein
VWLAISMEQGIESLLCYTSNKIYDWNIFIHHSLTLACKLTSVNLNIKLHDLEKINMGTVSDH